MKIKLTRETAYLLEDILLDVFHGLPVGGYEGNIKVKIIADAVQDKIHGKDILDEH